MSKMKGRSKVMAIKIDLKKAYDHLEWSFIGDTLKFFKLPVSLISLIMSCVSTSTIYVLFNRLHWNHFVLQEVFNREIPSFPIFLFFVWKFLEL